MVNSINQTGIDLIKVLKVLKVFVETGLEHTKGNRPAYGKECHTCHKSNHYAVVHSNQYLNP